MRAYNPGYLEGDSFYFPVRVYYSDTDAGGVVYHSSYLDFAEHARSEFLRYLGGDQQQEIQAARCGFVVKSVSIDYQRPAHLDDLLLVKSVITRCAAATIHFQQTVMRDDEVLTVMIIKAGYVSLDLGRPVPMPLKWRETFKDLMIRTAAVG